MIAPKFAPWMKVFPIARNEKRPPEGFIDWQHKATNDPAQIVAWAEEYPGCNWALACGPSGVGVVDVDGDAGQNSLEMYELMHGDLPATLEQKSPRGRHLIYRDPDALLAPSVGKLGPKLDTRGGASYILIAPSTINGVPYVFNNGILADLPAHVRENVGKAHEAVAAPDGVILDTPYAVTRATRLLMDYVARRHVAVQGQGGDDRTFAVACEVLNLGLSEDRAFDIINDIWNVACVPPWDADELRVKIENAGRYAQNEAGAWAVPPTSERISAEALDKLIADSVSPRREEQATQTAPMIASERTVPNGLLLSYMGEEISTIVPPRYLAHSTIPIPAVGIVFGKRGVFKTGVAVGAITAALTGTKLFGQFDCEQGDAVLVAGEGLPGLRRRIEAHAASVSRSMSQFPVLVVGQVPKISNDDEWQALVATIEARGLKNLKLICIDHLSIMLGGADQNDATVGTVAMQRLQTLSMHFNCTVIVLAHAGKEDDREVRGSSAFLDNVDFAYELKRVDDSDIVKVRCAKMRDGEVPKPFHLRARITHGAPVMVFTGTDDARRAAGQPVGLRRPEVAAAIQVMGACPGGVNEWSGQTGGISTKTLATEIARLGHVAAGDGQEPTESEINKIITNLNRGAKDGEFAVFVVDDGRAGRRWAIAPDSIAREHGHG